MSLRFRVSKSVLLPLLAAALAAFSLPAIAIDWQQLAPENGGFSVDFPGTPKLQTTVDDKSAVYLWLYGNNTHKIIVAASVADYYYTPPGVEDELHGDEVNFLKAMHGTSTSSKRGQTRGANGKMLPSSVFTFETETGMQGVSKVIMDGNTVYMTAVVWSKGADASDVLKRFTSTYKLLPRTKPPKPPTPAPAANEGAQ